MTHTIVPVILSGGSGTRLWPLSRVSLPKQFLTLTSERSLLQQTTMRAAAVSDAAPIFVCNSEHRFVVAEQLRAISVRPRSIILEPVGRNTAPAAAIAALLLAKDDPDAMLLLLPSDHVIADAQEFARRVAIAAAAVAGGSIATFGIQPTRPETGYGYIEKGAPIAEASGCFRAKRFVEKPDQKTAEQYLSSGDYYWNSGMFLFKAGVYLDELRQLKPEILASCEQALEKAQADLDFIRLDEETFAKCPSDSIDYAVMEHTKRAVVVPTDVGWNDVGSWESLWEVNRKTDAGNVVQGDVFTDSTSNTYISAQGRFVAALGVEDLVIVETVDAVLVANKKHVQKVKNVVEYLKAAGRQEHLNHRKIYRPWGSYEGIDAGNRFQVKRIIVKPGGKLSMQMHHHRAEHWVVVCGTARVTCGEKVTLLSENESTFIPLGTKHRLENPGKLPLELIEVQSGAYLGEDDIVRMDDIYGRG